MSTLNQELIQNIKLIGDEKKISNQTVADSLKDAIEKAYAKFFPESVVEVIIDLDKSILDVHEVMNVVEDYEDLNDYFEISVADAKKIDENLTAGSTLKKPVDLSKMDRAIAAYIFQVFKHNITTQSNKEIYNE